MGQMVNGGLERGLFGLEQPPIQRAKGIDAVLLNRAGWSAYLEAQQFQTVVKQPPIFIVPEYTARVGINPANVTHKKTGAHSGFFMFRTCSKATRQAWP